MMTAEEKADELIRRMTVDFSIEFEQSKLCALIAVDEIICVLFRVNGAIIQKDEIMHVLFRNDISSDSYKYWQEVKQEINKL